jgi:hypothetical protein
MMRCERMDRHGCVAIAFTDRFGAACGKDFIKSLIRDKLPKMSKKCGEEIKLMECF